MTRPCPFCGSTDIAVDAIEDDGIQALFTFDDGGPNPPPPPGGWFAKRNRCRACDAMGPVGLMLDEATNTIIPGATWNSRAQEALTR
ncbi:MAG: hypothetical protein ACYDD1_12425 [Caulobacteraceae bacterium]